MSALLESLQISGLSESDIADIGARTRKGAGEFGYVLTDDLHSHPVNVRIYGNEVLDAEFLESIEKVGILEPLVAVEFAFQGEEPKLYIVSGHRRWMAAKQVGLKKVPVRDGGKLYHGETQEEKELSLERNLLEANRQRLKTQEQLAREFDERKRIHSALATIRRQRVLRRGGVTPVKENFPERGQARDLAATETGIWSGKTAEKMSAIVQLADAGNAEAKAVVASINQGKSSIDKGYKHVSPLLPPPPPPKPKPEKTQAETMKALSARLQDIESPDAPTPPNKTHLKILAEMLEKLNLMKPCLAKVKNAESPEEYESVCQVLAAIDDVHCAVIETLKRTKNINVLVARAESIGFTGEHRRPYGDRVAGVDEKAVLRELKRFVAQDGWICTGGHQFVNVKQKKVSR